jgi:hypothetical protein
MAIIMRQGEGYTLEVHGASHYILPGQGGQSHHQDGQWRKFGGWNRHYGRRWQLPRKLMCFYYPHDVVSAPSAVVAGSQYFAAMTPALEAEAEEALLVPAGSCAPRSHPTLRPLTGAAEGSFQVRSVPPQHLPPRHERDTRAAPRHAQG